MRPSTRPNTTSAATVAPSASAPPDARSESLNFWPASCRNRSISSWSTSNGLSSTTHRSRSSTASLTVGPRPSNSLDTATPIPVATALRRTRNPSNAAAAAADGGRPRRRSQAAGSARIRTRNRATISGTNATQIRPTIHSAPPTAPAITRSRQLYAASRSMTGLTFTCQTLPVDLDPARVSHGAHGEARVPLAGAQVDPVEVSGAVLARPADGTAGVGHLADDDLEADNAVVVGDVDLGLRAGVSRAVDVEARVEVQVGLRGVVPPHFGALAAVVAVFIGDVHPVDDV